ncbi:hypothetical protein AGMMS49992_24630 [Clostridia bacterium]|nr:hypothetical protein AGMMS49992_24630 [Clostridia bacterium]
MTQERFDREINYALVMASAREMLRREIVTESDIRKIETIIRKKYCPISSNKRAG